ncbi:hypothetical protein SNE40_005722 [Patella caerulea]|uniref:Uncharacterized protein n=1 Tax=Patella caerulea TaxID=87958 RepID=A0AAN8PXS3_PATCE
MNFGVTPLSFGKPPTVNKEREDKEIVGRDREDTEIERNRRYENCRRYETCRRNKNRNRGYENRNRILKTTEDIKAEDTKIEDIKADIKK